MIKASLILRRRIEEMEEELQKTERSFKNQVIIILPYSSRLLCFLIHIIIMNLWTYFLMCYLFQIATHEKKAHDNWVRFFFFFSLFCVLSTTAYFGYFFSPIAQSSCCRKSYSWREERSCQLETQVCDFKTYFQCVLESLKAVLCGIP